MNEVFLIGKIIKEIEYKFMLEKGKHAKAIVYLELLDKTQLKVIAYNEEADYTMQNIRKNDDIFIYGMIKETEVVVKGSIINEKTPIVKKYYCQIVNTTATDLFKQEEKINYVLEDGTKFYGIIDRIDKNKDGTYSIYDYKTGDNKNSKIKISFANCCLTLFFSAFASFFIL